jgi:hypothetical protein
LQCPHCHQIHPDFSRFCPVTGKRISPSRWRKLIWLVIPIILILLIWAGLQLPLLKTAPDEPLLSSPQTIPQPTDTVEIPLATQEQPLAQVPFLEQVIDYPNDWPASLHYPEEFRLVEANAGSIETGTPTGFAAKLQYSGSPQQTVEQLSTFFTSNGWQIAEQTTMDAGGFLLLIYKNDRANQGILVIDQDPTNPDASLIIATVFP